MKITISANPATGKTELAHLISKKYGAKEYLEVADDAMTKLFYTDKKRYSFTQQVNKLVERLNFWIDSDKDDFAVIDQNLFFDMVYSKANWLTGAMSDEEYTLYHEVAKLYRDKMYEYAPDLDITLVGTVEHTFDNMAKRGRDFEVFAEGTPERNYFELLNTLNWEYSEEDHGFEHLVIDVTGRDFVNNKEDYDWIMGIIDAKIEEISKQ